MYYNILLCILCSLKTNFKLDCYFINIHTNQTKSLSKLNVTQITIYNNIRDALITIMSHIQFQLIQPKHNNNNKTKKKVHQTPIVDDTPFSYASYMSFLCAQNFDHYIVSLFSLYYKNKDQVYWYNLNYKIVFQE